MDRGEPARVALDDDATPDAPVARLALVPTAPRRPRSRRRAGTHWTPDEVATLRREWHEVSARTLVSKLGRTWCAIKHKAEDIGLPAGVPQGHVSLGAGTRLTGFSFPQLRRLLEVAEVRVHTVYPDPQTRRRSQTRCYVERDALVAAVAHWQASEYVGSAARTRGVCHTTLAKWLRASGVITAKAGKRRTRVPSAAIDRVVAERMPAYRAWQERRGPREVA